MAAESTLREIGSIFDRIMLGQYVSPADRHTYRIRAKLASLSVWPEVGHRDKNGNRPRAYRRLATAHRTGQMRRAAKRYGLLEAA